MRSSGFYKLPLGAMTILLLASIGSMNAQLVTQLSGTVAPTPLDIAVGHDGSIQVLKGGTGQLYSPTKLPISNSIYNSIILTLGTVEVGATSSKFNYSDHDWDGTAVSAVSGTGTTVDPWLISATLSSTTLVGVTIEAEFRYINGNEFFDVSLTPTVPPTNTAIVKVYHVLDTYLSGSDQGAAYVIGAAPYQFLGVEATIGGLFEGFIVGNTQWDHYMSAYYNDVVKSPTDGVDMTDALDFSTTTDNGIGVQWTLGVVTGVQPAISYRLSFSLAVPEICDNGIDDDLDGLIDCLDPDCNGNASCNDNDVDGISDVIDLDDDNDGMPDLDEGGNSVDTDADGVPDRFDLDSDNDGIYDLIEADHTQADADNNGVVDGAPAFFGINGLFDALETVADNGVLNYVIADSDSNGTIDADQLDSDNDGCSDVKEAGYADSDNDGRLGPPTLTVDPQTGVVTSGGP